MRIIFMGSGEFGGATLKWLLQSGHELLGVVTQPARPAGRGKQLQPTTIAQIAEQFHLKCLESANVNTPEFVNHVRSLKPDVILVIAFGQKIGSELINLPGCQVINLHGSLLPKYRGAAPVNWAIINGEKETGLTVIEINEIWDGGAILGQLRTEIKPAETAGELHDRMGELGPGLVAQVLGKLEAGELTVEVQHDSKATKAPKLTKADGAISWSISAEKICRQIHGMWPWPGAFCYVHKLGKKKRDRLIIAHAEVWAEDHTTSTTEWPETPGTLAEDMGIWCGTGKLSLLDVKAEGGKLISFNDLVNGWHLQKGDIFSDG